MKQWEIIGTKVQHSSAVGFRAYIIGANSYAALERLFSVYGGGFSIIRVGPSKLDPRCGEQLLVT